MDNGQRKATLGEQHLKYWQRWEYKGYFVYVLEAPPLTPVKIGFTNNVPARLASLQTGCPYPLRVRYVIPGNQTLETWLHRYMRSERLCGEWFDGPGVELCLKRIAETAQAIVDAHNPEKPAPPDFADFVSWIPLRIKRREIRKGQRTELVVRRVEPNPVPPEEAQRRLHERWMRKREGEWLDPAA